MHAESSHARRDRLFGLAAVAIAGLVWGTIPLILRAADGASVVKVFFRVFFAGLALGSGMLVTGTWRELLTLDRGRLRQVAAQGLILTLNWFLFLTALDMTAVATAELLAYMGPILVAALAPFVTGERFDRRIIAPLLAALVGIVVILVPHGVELHGGRALVGAGLAFLSALTYATLLLRSKRLLRGISSSAFMLIEYGVASVVLSPFVVAAYARGNAPSTVSAYTALITLGVVNTAGAGLIFLAGLRRVRTDHAATLTYVEPASAVLFAALFLGEPLSWATLLGGALVIAGGIAVALLEAREGVETVPLEAAGAENPVDSPAQERE